VRGPDRRRRDGRAGSLGIHLDRDAIDLDRLLDRLGRKRAASLFDRHSPIIMMFGGDGNRRAALGGLVKSKKPESFAARFQHAVDLAALEIEIAVEDESAVGMRGC